LTKTVAGRIPGSDKREWRIPKMSGINVMDFPFRVGMVDLDPIMAVVNPLLKQRRTCIQAGGCFGVWPVYFAGMFQSVITFEPEPVNYKCMVQNTSHLNNVRCVHAALWSGVETVGMGLPPRMHNNSGAYYIEIGKGKTPAVSIDSLEAKDVDLLALDVEGAEYPALVGAVETIERDHPVIVIEQKGHDSRYGGNSAVEFLCCDLGYREVAWPTPWDVVLV
jgi:FkbM family methyltransferase